jgi:hypothetical protein
MESTTETLELAGMTFRRISSEEHRTYRFPGGEYVRIDGPLFLHVSASGGHRIVDSAGASHYVPAGFIHITWKAREGQPAFVL